MAQGSLSLRITTLAGDPLRSEVEIDFEPQTSGGTKMDVSVKMGTATAVTITNLESVGGIGTRYLVTVRCKNYCPYSFFQNVIADQTTAGNDDVEMWIDPSSVKDISAPKLDDLDSKLVKAIESAKMFQILPEDGDLKDKSGTGLFKALGPKRKAALLNIFKKASHKGTSLNCAKFIRSLMLVRQDRVFAMVDPAIHDLLRDSEPKLFKSAPKLLHEPLPDFELVDSFKTLDPHANLQVTIMHHPSGVLAADFDIDESSGIEHGFEVIRNAVFESRTNPYLIHEFLIAADRKERTLDPGYAFVF